MSDPKDKAYFAGANVTEWLFRAVIGLLLYMGLGIKTDVAKHRETLNEIESNIKLIQQKDDFYTEALDDFIEKPRFTKDDFDAAITPLINQVNANTKELNQRSDFMDETTEKLIRLELKLEALK